MSRVGGQGPKKTAAPTAGVPRQEKLWMKLWRIFYPVGLHYLLTSAVYETATILLELYQVYVEKNLSAVLLAERQRMAQLPCLGISSVLLLLFLRKFYQTDETRRRLGYLGKPHEKQTVTGGMWAAAAVLGAASSQCFNDLLEMTGINGRFAGYAQEASQVYSGHSLLILAVVTGLLTPAAEELIFRGLIQKRIRDYLGTRWAVVLSALIFGLYHGYVSQVIFGVCVGIFLGLVLERTNQLLLVMVIHMVSNLWSFGPGEAIHVLALTRSPAAWAVIAVSAAAIVISLGYLCRNKRENSESNRKKSPKA